jgi:hypothetical protein
VGEDE